MAATTHPPAVMAASDASASAEGFWGEITSTIDWCEDNYAVSHYIAEFWNTVSSLLFVAAGVLGLFLAYRHRLENRYFWLNGCVIVIGCGSTMFHGTLQFGWQLWDEIPMIYTALVWVFLWVESATLRPRFMWLPWAMAAYGVLWTVLHTIHGFVTGFHANFGTLQALGILYAGYYSMFVSRNRTVFWLGNLYVWSFFIAFFFWNIDQIWCGRLRPFYVRLSARLFHMSVWDRTPHTHAPLCPLKELAESREPHTQALSSSPRFPSLTH